MRRKKYRRWVCTGCAAALVFLILGGWKVFQNRIPGKIYADSRLKMTQELKTPFDFMMTKTIQKQENKARQVSTVSEADRTKTKIRQKTKQLPSENACYEIQYKLFGKIPVKTVNAEIVPRRKLYVGGIPIGIYLKTKGVLVVGTEKIKGENGEERCPAESVLYAGDYIREVNGQTIHSKEDLISSVNAGGEKDLVLRILRNGEEVQMKLRPVKTKNDGYKAGIWIRSDTQGIGTLTYYDEEGRFGALGHGISDVDIGERMEIEEGILYEADVISVVKGIEGTPGELAGVIHYSEGYQIGIITENKENGIYGKLTSGAGWRERQAVMETAYKQEIECGPAAIRSTVDGVCREYAAEILEVQYHEKDVNKGIILKVTDPELIEKTGGIIQGMSGSPILQNGKIIGAVTHVFVNDPARGYGIFIENMESS